MFLLFSVHEMAIGLFRLMAAITRDMVIANTFGSAALLITFLLGGFMIPKGRIFVFVSYQNCLKIEHCNPNLDIMFQK